VGRIVAEPADGGLESRDAWGRGAWSRDPGDGAGEAGPRPQAGKFVPPAWDGPTPQTPSQQDTPPGSTGPEEAEAPIAPADNGYAANTDVPNDGQGHSEAVSAWHGETNGHGAGAWSGQDAHEEAVTPEPPRSADTGFYDDDDYEDNAPAFVAPEPTGRPDQAAEMMRTIAHSDTEYYLPPAKAPGMILLGVGGALVGAVLANMIYGMLGDVVIPGWIAILIGIQIFGLLGVFIGNYVPIPIGAPRKRTGMIQAVDDAHDWPEDWEEAEDHLDRGPFLDGPLPGSRDEGEPLPPETPPDPRAAMRPPPPPQ